MSDKIILRTKGGPRPSHPYVILGKTQCVIGRSRECQVRIPAPEVSRKHCLLEIDPPCVRVRDLGSRNGTFVNGVMIGRRTTSEPKLQGSRDRDSAIELQPCDELLVGQTVF